ncbi:MAG: hypothetical protein GXW98_04760 [Bifidobacterium crudilactis]|uniref:Uncharacterized protein n=1 Tax=Bifidobacterium crudilactis TaxID=327277 RepID=A0A971ICU0_9BIFI|nr:hypothetical protein [Bifidobacterium crudilactis]NLT79581.1 hypothetical protein [Bifidobacterium crudilactis]
MTTDKSFLARSFDNMREDARLQHDIDREHFEAVKGSENADFKEFREAKGFKAKLGVLLRDSTAIRAEQREEYRAMLAKMREDADRHLQ